MSVVLQKRSQDFEDMHDAPPGDFDKMSIEKLVADGHNRQNEKCRG